MNEVINILDQQFYSAEINQAIEQCYQNEKCAIIIDEEQLNDFLSLGKEIVGKQVNQIIIISENLNMSYPLFEGCYVLLVSVVSFENAIKIARSGAELINVVVSISDSAEIAHKRLVEILSSES